MINLCEYRIDARLLFVDCTFELLLWDLVLDRGQAWQQLHTLVNHLLKVPVPSIKVAPVIILQQILIQALLTLLLPNRGLLTPPSKRPFPRIFLTPHLHHCLAVLSHCLTLQCLLFEQHVTTVIAQFVNHMVQKMRVFEYEPPQKLFRQHRPVLHLHILRYLRLLLSYHHLPLLLMLYRTLTARLRLTQCIPHKFAHFFLKMRMYQAIRYKNLTHVLLQVHLIIRQIFKLVNRHHHRPTLELTQLIIKNIKHKLKMLVIRPLQHQQSVQIWNRSRNLLALLILKVLPVVNACDRLFLRVDNEKVLLRCKNLEFFRKLDCLLVTPFGLDYQIELLTAWSWFFWTAFFWIPVFLEDQIPTIAITKVLDIILIYRIRFKVVVVPDDWQDAHLSFRFDQHMHVCHSLFANVLIVIVFDVSLIRDWLVGFKNDRPFFGRFWRLNEF